MTNFRLLVVDDDPLIIESIKLCLPDNWILQGWNQYQADARLDFSAAFVDMHLDDSPTPMGLEVIKKLRDRQPHLDIVAISGDLDREIMEQCLKNGASRFLAKPLTVDEVQMTLEKIEALLLLNDAHMRQKQTKTTWVGNSAQSQKTKKIIADLTGESGPILISGESGTGKEIVANLLNAQEKDRPFVALNMAALPENLFESELFGHNKGAFSGAEQNKMGLAEAAHNGDLFLDEIEAMPLSQQVKLLRFLETGEIRRVGATESIHIDVRVIAATNRDLQQMVEAKEFREDLLWRLSGKVIQLAPLRERTEDIEELTRFFLERVKPRRQKELTNDAIAALKEYTWPGNVRELKRVCEQLSLTSPLPIIRDIDVLNTIGQKESAAPTNGAFDFSQGLQKLVEEFESQAIESCLSKNPDVGQAAQILGISRSNLYKKMKEYSIQTSKGGS